MKYWSQFLLTSDPLPIGNLDGGDEENILRYPTGSHYNTSKGFLNNLDAVQIGVLRSLQSW